MRAPKLFFAILLAQTLPPFRPADGSADAIEPQQCPQSKEISRPASALYCIIIRVTFCDETLQHHFCLSHIAHVSLVVFGVRICYFWECHKRAFCRTPFSAVTFPSTLSPYFLVMFVRSFFRSFVARPSVWLLFSLLFHSVVSLTRSSPLSNEYICLRQPTELLSDRE